LDCPSNALEMRVNSELKVISINFCKEYDLPKTRKLIEKNADTRDIIMSGIGESEGVGLALLFALEEKFTKLIVKILDFCAEDDIDMHLFREITEYAILHDDPLLALALIRYRHRSPLLHSKISIKILEDILLDAKNRWSVTQLLDAYCDHAEFLRGLRRKIMSANSSLYLEKNYIN
jgi:hypothetical protein